MFEQSRDGIINQAEPVLNEIVAHLPTGKHSLQKKKAVKSKFIIGNAKLF